ncbi:MAG: hypothetical protein NTZ55_03765 [Candidatus Roizmanbacteria bacterium]|nr:hypothetical protein [Candidatus Roizmanbacteria bacterium]
MDLLKRIYTIFFSDNKTEPEHIAIQSNPMCPYCQVILKKTPGAKTKCISCGNFIYVRTRPSDRKRVLATKQQADEIEEQWSIVSGTHDEYLRKMNEYKIEKDKLNKRFNQEPSDNDIKWAVLNKELIKHSRNKNWGLYRNTRLSMGDILRKEMKLKQALETYLEVCYLDVNGPANNGGMNDSEFPSFDPDSNAFVAPGIIEYIQRINRKLNLPIDTIKQTYIESNKKVYASLKLPLSPDVSWLEIEKHLIEHKVESG